MASGELSKQLSQEVICQFQPDERRNRTQQRQTSMQLSLCCWFGARSRRSRQREQGPQAPPSRAAHLCIECRPPPRGGFKVTLTTAPQGVGARTHHSTPGLHPSWQGPPPGRPALPPTLPHSLPGQESKGETRGKGAALAKGLGGPPAHLSLQFLSGTEKRRETRSASPGCEEEAPHHPGPVTPWCALRPVTPAILI